jgi:hypothetical protein
MDERFRFKSTDLILIMNYEICLRDPCLPAGRFAVNIFLPQRTQSLPAGRQGFHKGHKGKLALPRHASRVTRYDFSNGWLASKSGR